MTREERRRVRRRWLTAALITALALLCLALPQCSGVPEPGISAVAIAMR